MTEPRIQQITKTLDDLFMPFLQRILLPALVGGIIAIVKFVNYVVTFYTLYPCPPLVNIWHWECEHFDDSIGVFIRSVPMFLNIGIIGGIIGANLTIILLFRFIKITVLRWLLVVLGALVGGILAASLGVLFVDDIINVRGYTGSDSAAAPTWQPAVVISDNVVQDPDKDFDPNDGYSNRHDFTLSGAALFQIAIPPEYVNNPVIDLDIFVYDPNGYQAASSTSGGTNELINIELPMDGTWSVYVHGRQTIGPSADYDMYTRIIP